MNRATANHLNHLRKLSMPVSIMCGMDCRIRGGGTVNPTLLAELIRVEAAGTGEMIRQEIVSAAAEKREADITAPDWVREASGDCYTWMDRAAIPWAATARRWAIVKPQIQAALDAHNAKTMAEYEVYRLACSQGVAVPPREQP